MGFLDRFRKRARSVSLPQLCYDVAYFVLPHYAFKDLPRLADLCRKSPASAGPFFYALAVQMRKAEPNVEDAKRFVWHHGRLGNGREFFALEYPTPRRVDMSNVSVEQVAKGGPQLVLAPHFSAIIGSDDGAHYFILGRAPLGGGTTLRCIMPEGLNCNLGPGPEPILAAFLAAVQARISAETDKRR